MDVFQAASKSCLIRQETPFVIYEIARALQIELLVAHLMRKDLGSFAFTFPLE